MRFKLLGDSGLRVSELCLGTMTFGEEWGWGASKEESRKVFDAYVKAGGNFIDTANGYTNGTSEKLVGEFVGAERQRFVVATKYTLNSRPSDPNAGGNHRKNLVQSLEASLKRLNTDYIDLYWVHAWDKLTPTEEVMRALDDVVRAGKVLYVGISDTPAWVVARANTLAAFRGWTSFIGLQIPYSLIERTPERELLPMAKALNIGVTVWGMLGGGTLTGKYKLGKARPKGLRLSEGPWADASLTERNLRIAAEVDKVAKATGRSSSQVAIAWVRQQQGLAAILPILGVRTMEQLKDNLGSLELELTQGQLAKLDEASAIDPGFPTTFLKRVQPMIYGETYALTDAD